MILPVEAPLDEPSLPVAETALLSEAALAEDWLRPEEDAAWSCTGQVHEPIFSPEQVATLHFSFLVTESAGKESASGGWRRRSPRYTRPGARKSSG